MTTILLDALALLTVMSATFVIVARSPVVAVMYLIATFILAACYLICLGITFVGLAYLVVYVGAIAVLFLFVIMMLNVRLSEVASVGTEFTKIMPLGTLIGSLFLYEILTVVPASGTSAGGLTSGTLNIFNAGLLNVSNTNNGVHLMFTSAGADSTFTSLSQAQSLGLSLYTYGSLWLIVLSIILLLAMIGPIALCLRSRTSTITSLFFLIIPFLTQT